MLKVSNITKTFVRNNVEFNAVDDVSFEAKKGELIAFTGHSGSGKTTLLNIIAGMMKQTLGTLEIEGDGSIGYVLQGDSLLGNFTVYENVCMPAYLENRNDDFGSRAEELIERMGLSGMADDYPKNLSGGEKRRVAIARAMINNPSIILADEPTSNLDQENSERVMEILKSISDSGTTVLMTTHELEYVRYADRVLNMNKGKLMPEAFTE